MDPRRHRTRLRLDAALRALLAEKPLAEISVEEVSRRAGTTRQTFYGHFVGLADMLGVYLDALLAEIERRNAEIRSAPADEADVQELHRRKFERVFRDLPRDDPRLRALLDGVPGLAPEDRFAELVEKLIGATPENPYSSDPSMRRIAARFYTGAFVSVVRHWIGSTDRLPPEAMAQAFTTLIFRGWPDMAGAHQRTTE